MLSRRSVQRRLNLHKPRGITSRGAVDAVKRLVRPAKCGHAGTLDPLASGVLVVCVGKATRLIEYVQQMPKQYRATFLLGRTSPTEDLEGEVTELVDAPVPSRLAIEEACTRFVGTIEQRPPVFSALKIKGRPAYALARKGRTVELAARPVTIHSLEVVTYEYPELVLDITCSAGTYVRSLGRDLGESLGTGAVMSDLVRTAVGPFTLHTAVAPGELSRDNLGEHMQPALAAVESLPRVMLSRRNKSRNLNSGGHLSRMCRHPNRSSWWSMPVEKCSVFLNATPRAGVGRR